MVVDQVGTVVQKLSMQAAQALPAKDTQAALVYTITELLQEHTTAVEVVVALAHKDIIDILDIIKLEAARELL